MDHQSRITQLSKVRSYVVRICVFTNMFVPLERDVKTTHMNTIVYNQNLMKIDTRLFFLLRLKLHHNEIVCFHKINVVMCIWHQKIDHLHSHLPGHHLLNLLVFHKTDTFSLWRLLTPITRFLRYNKHFNDSTIIVWTHKSWCESRTWTPCDHVPLRQMIHK